MKRRDLSEWPDGAPRLLTAPGPEERGTFARLLRRPFFVISDTHFFHSNIVRYAGRPADHDAVMLARWRATVARGDAVLHLGDLLHWRGTGLQRFSTEIAPRLTGEKFLLLGSHDREEIDYAALGFRVLRPFAFEHLGYEVSFSHWPFRPAEIQPGERRLRVHGHIHNRGYRNLGEVWSPLGSVNVSVEMIDYTPALISDLLRLEVARHVGD